MVFVVVGNEDNIRLVGSGKPEGIDVDGALFCGNFDRGLSKPLNLFNERFDFPAVGNLSRQRGIEEASNPKNQ